MADGLIKIDIEVDGKQIVVASKELDGLEAAAIKSGTGAKKASDNINNLGNASKNASGGVKGTADSLSNMGKSADDAANSTKKAAQEAMKMGDESGRASMSIKDIAVSLGLVAVAAAAFAVLKSSLDGAISRFDTLVGFPKIMEQMGYSSEQAKGSIDKLSDGIQGLPTTLDGIVNSTKSIALLTGDLGIATDTALSLNNAFLASGSTALDAERGLTQYVQMLSKGSVDMQSWRTLQETMGFALNKTAEAFGFAGQSAQNDLYAALKEGDITFDAFNAKIIELNGEVGGFAEVALTSSAGIKTSMGNLKNATVVGIANMITAFNNLSEEVTGKSIAENLNGLKVVVGASFKFMVSAIETATPVVELFAGAVTASVPVVQALTPAIIGLVAAYAAYTVITKASAAIEASGKIMALASAAQKGLTLATNAQITSAIAEAAITEAINLAKQKNIVLTHAEKVAIAQKAIADKAATIAGAAELGLVSARSVAMGVLTGQITLATAAIAIKTAATYAWGAAIKFLMGPIGWITAGIALLVTGVIAVVKWFNKSTEEGERLAGVTEGLAESTKSLNDSVNGTSDAYERNKNGIESTAVANTDLIAKIEELLAVEDKSAAHKKELQGYVDQLNGSVDGLSLAYSKEADSLSLSSEQIAAKIALMKEQETLIAGQERFVEISKEQSEIDMKLAETNALREEWNGLTEQGGKSAREAKEGIAELDEQEAALIETKAKLAEQQVLTEQQITASIEAVAAATEKSVTDQVVSYEFLEDRQKDLVDSLKSTWEDYKKQASDMFSKLSDKSKVSIAEMNKNMEENQRVMAEWADNIALLAKRGLDEGLIDELRKAGPESAGHVKAIVSGSDAELQKMNSLFAKAGSSATKTLGTSIGAENSVVMDSVGHLVTQTGDTLTAQIKKADFESLGAAVPDGAAKGITTGTKGVTDATKKMAEETQKMFKGQMDINSPSGVFEKFGGNITDGTGLGIDKGTPKVIQTTKQLAKTMVDQFKGIKDDFIKIGQEASAGLDQGIKSGSKSVMATARSLADTIAVTMRKALDIHSPSRVTTKIGKQTGDGLAVGIESTKAKNVKAMNNIGKAIAKATKANAKAAAKSAADQIKREADAVKARLESVKTSVADKKSLDKLSLVDEAKIWERSIAQFKVGSKERIEAQKSYKYAVNTVNKEVESINKDHLNKINDINNNLAKSEQKLNDDYNNAFSSRVDSILGFSGIFEEFSHGFIGDGHTLIKNLESQVQALEVWDHVLGSLGNKIDNQSLLEELEGLGPKAVGQLQALNNLTDEELAKYVVLYNERFSLAREKATVELSGMKKDTVASIDALRLAANAELALVEKEWVEKIGLITKATDDKLKGLKDIGVAAGTGLLDGLSSMESSLVNKATSIAEAVKKAMASALDIHSPSRWMRDMIGKNMMVGWMDGIDAEKSATLSKMREAAEWMKPSVAIPKVNISPFNTSAKVGGSSIGSTGGAGVNMDELYEAIDKLASRPNVIEIDGRQVVQATAVQMDSAIKGINQQNNKYRGR